MTTTYSDLIKESAKLSADSFLGIATEGAIAQDEFIIRCKELGNRNWHQEDITHSEEFKELFNQLFVHSNLPVLYIFEIAKEPSIKRAVLVESITEYSSIKEKRAFPVFTKDRLYNYSSNVLYVGKVKRNFHGRIIQHMGYFPAKATQGLQLVEWAAAIELVVKVSYFVYKPEIVNLIGALEYQMAERLKPLLGKHK